MAKVGDRFKTGDKCVTSGIYAFDGYVDGTASTAPSEAGKRIPLSEGERFPPAAQKAAYWKLERLA